MTDGGGTREAAEERGRGRLARPRRVRRRDETSVTSGLMGITAVALATLVVSLLGAAVALVVALLY